jgi:hypothetical protein
MSAAAAADDPLGETGVGGEYEAGWCEQRVNDQGTHLLGKAAGHDRFR